jgi:3-hydroxyacyl-CoA dehydrogenase
MGNINAVVDLVRDGDVAIITMQNPPVNALGHALREGLLAAFASLREVRDVRAVVLTGSARAFSGGADITEFGKPPLAPHLGEVITAIEAFDRPVVAAISGVALGGGLELALGCHYRVAAPGSRLGLPEVKLGILPGAGGTQRLPRVMGPVAAMKAIVSGSMIAAEEAGGLIDAICADTAAAVAFARGKVGAPLARVRDRDEKLLEARANPAILDEAAAPLLKRARGQRAPAACIEAVRAAVTMSFPDGIALERKLFMELVASDESRAQRHVFFAEREAQKVPGMQPGPKPEPVQQAVIIGAGTMGGGIAMCFANAGIPVTLIEANQEALDRGMAAVEKNYRTAVARGSIAESDLVRRMGLFTTTTEYAAAAHGDVIIEAVFETMAVKQEVFARLDAIAKPGALLASNTSTLDIDAIAAFTRRPQDVLGMHFFSPANVMKLLEIVRGRETSDVSLAKALAIGRTIGKVSAVVGVCDGFVGNRMLHKRSAQAERLLLEGALPQEVDAVVTEFGFPMGPYAMGDLAGLDVGWRIRQGRGTTAPISDALCEAGRFGQKTGAGYYKYEGRTPAPDPEVERIIAAAQRKAGVNPRTVPRDEIFERMFYPMINEGARILEEGIATRPSDVDVIWIYGYGWPAWTGGPMHYADKVGLRHIAERLNAHADRTGDETLRPAALLQRLADLGEGFVSPPPEKVS